MFSEPTPLLRLHLACEMCHSGWWSITKHSLHHIGIEEPVNKFGVPLRCLVFFRWISKFQRHPLTWFLLQYSLEDMRCFRSKHRVSTTFRRYLKVQTTCKNQKCLWFFLWQGSFLMTPTQTMSQIYHSVASSLMFPLKMGGISWRPVWLTNSCGTLLLLAAHAPA